jgi:hypothetical protein
LTSIRSSKLAKSGVAALFVAGSILGTAGVASAAPDAHGPQPTTLQCTDLGEVTILTTQNNSSDHGGWAAARIVSGGSGTLIPTSFSMSVYDTTQAEQLFGFTQPKGGGNANHNRDAVTCTQTETGTVADMLEPGEQPPPDVPLTDEAVFTFTATAVYVP